MGNKHNNYLKNFLSILFGFVIMIFNGCNNYSSRVMIQEPIRQNTISTIDKHETAIDEVGWGKYEDAVLEVQYFNQDVHVNKDTTYEIIGECQLCLTRRYWTSMSFLERLVYKLIQDTFPFPSFANDPTKGMHYTILEAKTIHNGKESIVDKDTLEKWGNNNWGFAIPKREGVSIYLKYRIIKKDVYVGNLFRFYHDFTDFPVRTHWKQKNTSIHSKLPLNIQVNDPRDVLEIKQERKDKIYKIHIKLKKPLYENPIHKGILNKKHITWVTISNTFNWKELAQKFAPGYNKVINQPLPSSFAAIAKAAVNKQDEIDKLKFVLAALHERIQYHTQPNLHLPRNLEEIAHSKQGDCKDFVVSTAAILKRLGYKVQPALVMCKNYEPKYKTIPVFHFNHVILSVISKNGERHWLETTSPVGVVGPTIFESISNRKVLILDPKQKKVYINTPSTDFTDLKSRREINLKIGKNTVNVHTKKSMQGAAVAKPRELSSEYKYENVRIKSPPLNMDIIRNAVPGQLPDLYIGPPRTYHNVIKSNNVINVATSNFEINFPWLSIKRSFEAHPNSTILSDSITIRKGYITHEEMKCKQFKSLQEALIQYYPSETISVYEKNILRNTFNPDLYLYFGSKAQNWFIKNMQNKYEWRWW